MASRAATLILLSVLHACSPADPDPVRQPVGWFQRCLSSTNLSMTALEVLPGGGWDNLRNLDMARVMDFSYAQCQTTEDGIYFIPDDTFVVPRKVTNIETHAEVFSSWMDHRSSTAASINVDASGILEELGELNGKLSAEHQRVKTNQINDKSATTRVQVRNRIYTVKANPDFRLDSLFVQQVKNIAGAITDNQAELTTYLSEKLVADYGTHVITSVDAGAALVKEDYIKSSYVTSSDSSMTSIKASAGYSFFGLFSIDIHASFSHDSSEQSAYNSSVTSSFMEGHGGSPYYPGMSLREWQESTRNNLVGIDRSGLPLHLVINTNTLPDLPDPIVSQVADSLQQAIERYYGVNTHPGCVDINSPNFNPQANFDDGSCDGVGHSLGGVFLECKCRGHTEPCNGVSQRNPDTGDYTCRSPYQQILVESYGSPQFCQFHTYWCYSNGPIENKWFIFGGFRTNDMSCPSYFKPFKFLVVFVKVGMPSDTHYICLSQERAARAVHFFGGFFSCHSTNPLTGRRDCPPEFSQKILGYRASCPISYCVKSRSEQLLPVRLPPFTARPVIGQVNVGQSRSSATVDGQDAIKRSVAESADVSGENAGLTDVSGQKAGLVDVSGQKAGLADVSGQKAGLADVSGENAGLTDVSGQKAGLADVSGQKAGLADVSGQKAGLADVSGQKAGLADVSGQKAGLADVSGENAGLTDVSGQKAGLADVSGQKAGLADVSGQKAGLADVSGQKAGLADVSAEKAGLADVSGQKAEL